ncbi:MAG: histidinol phosphatase [Clostridia bacterium]|nr:histidinol phosphatase [Clostridia bacterium]
MYRYETHCHTAPVSACGRASVRETMEFYKSMGYDGIFITNHFLDGNIGIDWNTPVNEKLDFYFSDYEEAVKLSAEIGIKVFLGVEMSYGGTDFLVYGLDKEWWYDHTDILNERKSRQLPFMMQEGALVVHAHPFREANYIDHIRLFPRGVEGVEVINAERTDFENRMAQLYADEYGFLKTAGSDNHWGNGVKRLAGMESDEPVTDVQDFIKKVRDGKMSLFTLENK